MDDQTADGYSTPALHGQPGGDPEPRLPGRRKLLAAGVVVAATAAGGVVLGRSAGRTTLGPLVAKVPAELAAAAAAERTLIALAAAAITTAHGRRRAEMRLIRSDHATHLVALEASIATAVYPATPPASPPGSTSPSGSLSAPGSLSASGSAAQPGQSGSVAGQSAPGVGATRSTVRSAEQRAAGAAAARGLRLTGADAVLLASIAAAEASHAELLA